MIDLQGIISISGKPGLHRLLKSSSKGVIVESMENGKRLPADPHQSISALEDITIHTQEGDIALGELFQRIHDQESGSRTIDHRSSKEELLEHFEKVLPEYDREQVYPSDIKKCFQWYNILYDAGALQEKEEENEEGASEEGTESGKDDDGSEEEDE